VTQASPADVVVQKLRALLKEKAAQAPSGSPEQYRLQEMLELSDDALLDTIYSSVEPNPDRVGCPPREALRELAMRTRPLSDPLWDHVMECAPCRIDVREMGRERPAMPVRSAALSVGLATAAILALIIGVGAWILTRGAPTPTVITGDLRQYAVMRSERPLLSEPAFDLPPRLVRLTLVLPTGSEPGAYDIEVRGTDDRARTTAAGKATLRNFITRLSTDIDLRSAPRGPSQLAIRRTGEDWQLFPVRIQ
jgi:hypothetical protein